MDLTIPIFAAVGCSLCNGISTVLQKTGADEEAKIKSLNVKVFLRLLKNKPYMGGIIFAMVGWALSLVALQELPLFLVQTVMAASIVVTAAGERIVTHRPLGGETYKAVAIVLLGLAFVAISSQPSKAIISHGGVNGLVEIAPMFLAIIGIAFIYIKNRLSSIALALIGGICFGGTSVVGRILIYPHHLWLIIENPLVWALVFYAILGQYFFTISLQRTTGTKSNSLMITSQTFFPALIGLLYFNDKIRNDFNIVVLVGSILVVYGCIKIARVDTDIPKNVAV
jgi:drug/metabolite transporter (DMT)-like permease